MIPTRQRFRALMAALAHFWSPEELNHWLETPTAAPSPEISWPALLWGIYGEPQELSGWAASVGQWRRSGDVTHLGVTGIFLHQARYRWEIATTGANPWLGGAIAAWSTGEIPQSALDFVTLQQAIACGDRLYRCWTGLGENSAPAVPEISVAIP